MPDCINTVTIKALVQENGIIRLADTCQYIGRLDCVTFEDVSRSEAGSCERQDTTPEAQPPLLTEEEIQQLEAVTKETTQGKWDDLGGSLWVPRYGGMTTGLSVPRGADATFCAKMHNAAPRLFATMRYQQKQLETARKSACRDHQQIVDAIAHPEDWTKMRAIFLQQEAAIGRRIGRVFPEPTGETSAKMLHGFPVIEVLGMSEDTFALVGPMVERMDLKCANCGGIHRYMRQVVKPGAEPVWVGCYGQKPTPDTPKEE